MAIRDLNNTYDPHFLHRLPDDPPPTRHPEEFAPRPVARAAQPPLAPISDLVNSMTRELHNLRAKSDSDDRMIALLKEQHQQARADLTGINRKHALEMENMRINYEDTIADLTTRCDAAEQKAQEVSDILDHTAQGVMQGLRKMRGDLTPPPAPPRQAQDGEEPDWQRVLNEVSREA